MLWSFLEVFKCRKMRKTPPCLCTKSRVIGKANTRVNLLQQYVPGTRYAPTSARVAYSSPVFPFLRISQKTIWVVFTVSHPDLSSVPGFPSPCWKLPWNLRWNTGGDYNTDACSLWQYINQKEFRFSDSIILVSAWMPTLASWQTSSSASFCNWSKEFLFWVWWKSM